MAEDRPDSKRRDLNKKRPLLRASSTGSDLSAASTPISVSTPPALESNGIHTRSSRVDLPPLPLTTQAMHLGGDLSARHRTKIPPGSPVSPCSNRSISPGLRSNAFTASPRSRSPCSYRSMSPGLRPTALTASRASPAPSPTLQSRRRTDPNRRARPRETQSTVASPADVVVSSAARSIQSVFRKHRGSSAAKPVVKPSRASPMPSPPRQLGRRSQHNCASPSAESPLRVRWDSAESDGGQNSDSSARSSPARSFRRQSRKTAQSGSAYRRVRKQRPPIEVVAANPVVYMRMDAYTDMRINLCFDLCIDLYMDVCI